jgi:excinuclease ABC subunit B
MAQTKYALTAPFEPAGDQPKAIAELVKGLQRGDRFQTLLGVTGSGKTMTMANVIAQHGKPALVLSHNKTLAAQLYGELKSFFPLNAVEYFISYYDYYQPEAYVPSTDTYIEKDASINEDIDRLRLRATSSLMERSDVVIVSTVSAIYGLGDPESYKANMVTLEAGQRIPRDEILRALVRIQYNRNDVAFERGTFRVRGDTVEVPAGVRGAGDRVELWGDEVERITRINALTGETIAELARTAIYPAKHFITSRPSLERAGRAIRAELDEPAAGAARRGKLLEAQRLESRTNFDIEMMLEIGTCAGHRELLAAPRRAHRGRAAGVPLRLLPRGLPRGRRREPRDAAADPRDVQRRPRAQAHARRLRLPPAERARQPPARVRRVPRAHAEDDRRVGHAGRARARAERGRRRRAGDPPTGLVDPEIEIRPVRGQVDDLLDEIRIRERRGERVLVTDAHQAHERGPHRLPAAGGRARALHALDIDAIERMEIVRGLRLGEFDVLVGINLLREGLDMPEVSLVAILDADQEGFLRSDRSLIQTVGRAARHVRGRAIFYADRITGSMQRCMEETTRRRTIQRDHNTATGSCRAAWRRAWTRCASSPAWADAREEKESRRDKRVAEQQAAAYAAGAVDPAKLIEQLEKEMREAAVALDFEAAARIRDQLFELRAKTGGAAAARRGAAADR